MRSARTIVAVGILLFGASSCAIRSRPVSSVGTSSATAERERSSKPAGESEEAPDSNSRTAEKAPADPPAGQETGPPDVAPPASAPKLLSDTESAEKVQPKLDRAIDIADRLARRNLSAEQADLLLAGKQFVSESVEALAVEEVQRATVLVDKALVILEELEEATRP